MSGIQNQHIQQLIEHKTQHDNRQAWRSFKYNENRKTS